MEGRRSIHGMAPEELELRPTWAEAFPRYLTIHDELFGRALAGCEFEFVHSLLGVRCVSDAGCDAWVTTEEVLGKMEPLINATEDRSARRHLKLWLWGHLVEANEPNECESPRRRARVLAYRARC